MGESEREIAARMRCPGALVVIVRAVRIAVRVCEAFQRTQLVRKGHHARLDLRRCRTLGEKIEALQTFDQQAVD